jgi:hypothetical protein
MKRRKQLDFLWATLPANVYLEMADCIFDGCVHSLQYHLQILRRNKICTFSITSVSGRERFECQTSCFAQGPTKVLGSVLKMSKTDCHISAASHNFIS